ncbi:hypothetical protein HanRHA438_Chr09g0380601 [Helianthus annuus]|nr:hypothetical protein HanIR_Chr09g0398101 [Helianthus annuus]KAJ0886542.1 hypothetical protein HanRHA438_Chr09g0380601 [Helianthus annuus]
MVTKTPVSIALMPPNSDHFYILPPYFCHHQIGQNYLPPLLVCYCPPCLLPSCDRFFATLLPPFDIATNHLPPFNHHFH